MKSRKYNIYTVNLFFHCSVGLLSQTGLLHLRAEYKLYLEVFSEFVSLQKCCWSHVVPRYIWEIKRLVGYYILLDQYLKEMLECFKIFLNMFNMKKCSLLICYSIY